MATGTMPDLDWIIRYENGELESIEELIDGFAALIRSGVAWQLQGSVYGRPARALIDDGWIDEEGNVLGYPEDDV